MIFGGLSVGTTANQSFSLYFMMCASLLNGYQLNVIPKCREEFGLHKGLGVVKGRVVKFRPDPEHKVPHMGWNTVEMKKEVPMLKEIQGGDFFYFVHSYYVVPDDKGWTATTTHYGISFTSSIWKDNIFATQFHPEKSQEKGLKILETFARTL